MRWRTAGRESADRLKAWLLAEEWRHVALTSRLRTSPLPFLGQTGDGRLWVREGSGGIAGGFFLSRWGVGLPAFDTAGFDSEDKAFLRRLLRSRRDRLFSLIGTSDRVRLLESLIGDPPRDAVNYRLLEWTPLPTTPEPRPGKELIGEWEVRRATPQDVDLLWPLEKAYLLEEVVLVPGDLDEHSARRHFAVRLEEQEIYFGQTDRGPVSKAGTNARGWGYDQIGGVFTVPEFRGRGLAGRLMSVLLSSIAQSDRRACLFVKGSNAAAIRLYKGLGFVDRGDFRISYWSR